LDVVDDENEIANNAATNNMLLKLQHFLGKLGMVLTDGAGRL
jgi:hypothetical protein